MTCIVVTCGGMGDVWRFETRTIAYLHPLCQYGDAIMTDPADLLRQYNRTDWSVLRMLAGLHPSPLPATHRGARAEMEMQIRQIWDGLREKAAAPPTNPQVICDMVSRDRKRGLLMAKKKSETETAAASNAAEKTPAAPAERPPVARGPRGVAPSAQIFLGTNKEGRAYGPDNNPKRPGSATHTRFAEYRDGMTVAQAMEAGLTAGDISYDVAHGFIKISGTVPAEVAADNKDDVAAEEADQTQPPQGQGQDQAAAAAA